MFLLDSLLLAPGKAVLFMFEELAKKAQAEFLDDDSVKQELQDIYARLEAGAISEQEFETRELRLMQRLEQIARAKFEGSWGTPGMGLQRAFLQGLPGDDLDVIVTEAVKEAEVLPATVPVSVGDVEAIAEPIACAGGMDAKAIDAGAHHLRQGYGGPPKLHAEAEAPALPPSALGPLLQMIAAAIPAQADRPLLTPPAPPAPAPTPPVAGDSAAVPVSPASAPTLTMAQVIESTLRHLSMLKLKVSAVTAVSRAEDGWRVTAELLERKAVPDTSDLLGVYDLQLDAAGNVLRYERTHMRRRADLGR